MTDKIEQLNELLEKTIETEVSKRVGAIEEENSDLRVRIAEYQSDILNLKNRILTQDKISAQKDLSFKFLSTLKHRFESTTDKNTKENILQSFLESIIEPDFKENTYECSLWMSLLTKFYSNKDMVIALLTFLDVDMPQNVKSFRLPHEWTTEELDIVFDTMRKHIVCNSCTYADNLRFWQPHALDDVYNVCYNCLTYSEIPWQFLLRNPNLLNKKYLKKIGKMAYEEPYISGWRYLFAIDKYQDLTDEQIKTIIKEIDGSSANISKENSVSEFLLRHLDLIEDSILIDKIYKKYWDSYSFRYENRILKMPVDYLELWVKEKAHCDPREALEWIIRNKNNFSEEQKNNLLKLVMSEVLK